MICTMQVEFFIHFFGCQNYSAESVIDNIIAYNKAVGEYRTIDFITLCRVSRNQLHFDI